MPSSSPESALNKLCTVERSATPEMAGAIRTKADILTSFPYNPTKKKNVIYVGYISFGDLYAVHIPHKCFILI
jgi:hypothetical protein